jgi:O-6-methylguanine DNA methyltransferase
MHHETDVHGWCSYALGGTTHYLVVWGGECISHIELRTDLLPQTGHDPALDGYACMLAKWLLTGNMHEVPFKLKDVSSFERSVLETLEKVPHGYVTSYGAIARALGVKSPRAVGQALKRNPLPLIYPCHRIVSSNSTLGGFSSGTDLKRHLLEREGACAPDGTIRRDRLLADL